MRTQLIALLVGVAVLGSAGIARADAMTMKDFQLDKVTAGTSFQPIIKPITIKPIPRSGTPQYRSGTPQYNLGLPNPKGS